MLHQLSTLTLTVLALFAGCSAHGFAQVHPELLVACDANGKLVVKIEAPQPQPLAASRFDGVEGYADALPGFNSLLEARPSEALFPPATSSNLVFVLLAADEGITVWNDHGSAKMKVGEIFTLGHPAFDFHPVWNIDPGAKDKPYTLKLRLCDTTGQHKDSEIFAPTFRPDDATVLYACPMRCQLGKQYTQPGLCPVCEMRLKLFSGKNYRVDVKPKDTPAVKSALADDGRVRAGIATPLSFVLTAPDGAPVSDLEIVHEKLLHLLMVSEDLSWFAHEHPLIQPDGTFELAFAFPHGGRYVLYNDFTPQRTGMQVVPVALDIAGDVPASVPLRISAERTQTVDGYSVRFEVPSPLTSLRTQDLRFHLERDGAPVTDLEPFLGALGHLIVISEDRKHFVHSHPMAPAKSSASASPPQSGPDIVFSALFPAAGLYKAWGQFQHKGHVITAPFVFEVTTMVVPPYIPPTGARTKSGGER